MKRFLIVLMTAVVAVASLSAQSLESDRPDATTLPIGDARAFGFAGAMTAVNDDMNSLFYNPAGLAFLRRNYLSIEAGLGGNMEASVETMDADGNITQAESAGSYYEPVIFQPRVIMGGKGWGLAFTADYVAYDPSGSGYTEDELYNDTSIILTDYVSRRIGVVGGLGFNLGPIALGANVKYYGYSDYSFDYCPATVGTEMIGDVLLGPDGLSFDSWDFGVGVGALVTLGSINVGAYYGNLAPFINAIASGEDYSLMAYVDDCFKTMSLGVSFMPSDSKFSKHKSPIDLIASADFKNLGDNEDRELCAGVEAGLDLWNVLVATGRVGYTQALPTDTFSMDSLIDAFNIDNGDITIGATAKFTLFKADLGLYVPLTDFLAFFDSSIEAMTTTTQFRASVAICL